MGQVFTWEALRSRMVPKQSSFTMVADTIRAAILQEPSIVSSVLFGSVVRGDSNVRSDLDCVVVYDARRETAAMATMHELDRFANRRHVPINFVPCDTEIARTRLHHLGGAFVRHLQASIEAGGNIKGELGELLSTSVSTEEEIEWYIRMKMYKVVASYAKIATSGQDVRANFLKKALEAPIHVARKVLIYRGLLGGDSKRDVLNRYREVMPDRLGTRLARLVLADTLYTKEVEIQLVGPNKVGYGTTTSWLLEEVPPTLLRFLRGNIKYLNAAR